MTGAAPAPKNLSEDKSYLSTDGCRARNVSSGGTSKAFCHSGSQPGRLLLAVLLP